MRITNPSAFASAQAAWDNRLPPSYYDTEPEAKERWLEHVSLVDTLDASILDEILFTLLDGNFDIAKKDLKKLVDAEWEKQKHAH